MPRISHLEWCITDKLVNGIWWGHLAVWRSDGKDGITWDQLQAVKNEVLGMDTVAVEIYPADCDLVNDVNRRHLWVPLDPIDLPNLRQ